MYVWLYGFLLCFKLTMCKRSRRWECKSPTARAGSEKASKGVGGSDLADTKVGSRALDHPSVPRGLKHFRPPYLNGWFTGLQTSTHTQTDGLKGFGPPVEVGRSKGLWTSKWGGLKGFRPPVE